MRIAISWSLGEDCWVVGVLNLQEVAAGAVMAEVEKVVATNPMLTVTAMATAL